MAQIDLTKLGNEFVAAYNDYYDNGDVGDFDDMLAKGLELTADKELDPLLCEFAAYRHDILTSDRELAAFAKAYTKITSVKPRKESVKIYHIPMDDHMVQLVLTALMEKAHQKGISQEAKSNYLQAYGDIKESLTAQ